MGDRRRGFNRPPIAIVSPVVMTTVSNLKISVALYVDNFVRETDSN